MRGDVWTILRRIVVLAKPERPAVLAIVAVGLVAAVFEGFGLSLLIPLAHVALTGSGGVEVPFLGATVARVFGSEPSTGLMLAAVAVGLVAGLAVGVVNLLLSTRLSLRFAERLRGEVFEAVLRRPVSQIEDLPPGRMMNIMATESWRACDALFVAASVVVQAVAIAVLAGFLVAIAPALAAVLALLTAAMALTIRRATRRMHRLGSKATAANEGLTSYLFNALNGLRVIRGFGREPFERRRFARRSTQVSAVFLRLTILNGVVGPLTQLMTIAIVGVMVALAAARGDDAATVIGFLAIAYRLQGRVSGVLGALAGLRGYEASIREVERATAPDPSPDEAPTPIPAISCAAPFDHLRGEIALDDVWVRYRGADGPALRGVSCRFPAGAVTAVAGRSGAGKSTLVALLLRFVAPERGQVLVDGVPLPEIDPRAWHERIAFVEQNAFLFNASVRVNISYGRLGADLDAIREAARRAQADEFIGELERGYDTVIGERGSRLSQGQRQRIALARALLRDPDVLILDEATNALDLPTERALRGALRREGRPRAVIVIAHRRETVGIADRVVVLEDGAVVQEGPPAALIAAPGLYARLYEDEPKGGEP